MEQGKKYIVTIADKSQILVGVKELYGTDVLSEEIFVEEVYFGRKSG